MVNSYVPPTYYSTLHDSVASLCKTILPFSFKKRRLPAAAAAKQKQLKHQSDNLKWQQDSFHQILNLMGLHKEGILDEADVSAFRSHLLHSLIEAARGELEKPVILKDKLVFLQELLYAKCISEDEYHSSKRPLLQRLAAQETEIDARDVIASGVPPLKEVKETIAEEWSVIDLKDDTNKEGSNSKSSKGGKHGSAMKQIKGGAASVLGFVSPHKHGKNKEDRSIFELVNDSNHHETSSILMLESLPCVKDIGVSSDTTKRKPFRSLFHKEQKDGNGDDNRVEKEKQQQQTPVKSSAKKKWGIDGLKKWKKNETEDETTPLHLNERSDEVQDTKLNVVSEEFKDNDGGEIDSLRNAATEKQGINSAPWTTFHDDENCHPNLFGNNGRGNSKFHETNPFCDDHITNNESNARKLRATENQDQNPFWVPGHGY